MDEHPSLFNSPQNTAHNSSRVGARIIATAGALVTLCLGAGASAQNVVDGAFSVQKFTPGPGPRNFVTTRGARTDGRNAFDARVVVNYGNEPFKVDDCRRSPCTAVLAVQNIATMDLMAAYTPIPRLQIGLRLPLTFVQGQGITPEGGAAKLIDGEGIESFGLADPELELKGRIYGGAKAAFVLGAAGFVTAPLGEATAEGSYIGSESVTAGVRAIADGSSGPVSFGLNLGYRVQSSGKIQRTSLGSEAIYGVALGLNAGPLVRFVVDAFGATRFSDEAGSNSFEIDGAAQLTPLSSPVTVMVGGGAGLIQGAVGVPNFRVLAGFGITKEKRDEDGDGVAEADDLCPTEPEDLDGYEDADGCPELDNDNDALRDSDDKCPNEAEDIDKFRDQDGCPDPDNDADGIKDVQDKCPDEPENNNGYEDEDGCPDKPDRDGDGVTDDVDKCPQEAEDTDGFEDTDGCFDADNDGDGIPDAEDECVDEAEDINGTDDEDGCPEEV